MSMPVVPAPVLSAPALTASAAALAALSDEELLAEQDALAVERRRLDVRAAAVAAEIARRSSRELGHSGLAQRLGARSAEQLVQRRGGITGREAGALVRVGALLASEELPALAASVAAGSLSLSAADAIATGLGPASDPVPAAVLDVAAAELAAIAPELTVETLAARAREARAALDEESVADRERALRDRRFLHLVPQPDGMTRITGLLDPESAAIVGAAYDAVTSPRRGGPRVLDPDELARQETVLRDERTTAQLALDALVELIRIGSAADDGRVLGAGRHAVRVLVTDADLARRAGAGHLEGQGAPVSIATVERHVCDAGTVPIRFDREGQVVDVGRERRLYTTRQRIGLAARDGGCRFPGCDRPPSWCEAHHIDEWGRDHGRTDVRDGVLLCRFHHLLVHDNGWRIRRIGAAEYVAVPPASLDPAREPVPMPARSPAARRLRT